MILTVFCLGYVSNVEDIQPNKPFSTFPKKIGEWVGDEQRFDKRVYDVLGVDDSILANYLTLDGRQVQLYVGFYQSQREGDLIHSPKNCMPGAGWKIIAASIEDLVVSKHNPENINLIKLVLQKGVQRQIVLYWFQSRGRIIASEYSKLIYLVIDSITRHRTDGSFVRLIAPVVGEDEERTLKDLKDFAKLLMPVLQEYIPS